MFFEQARAQTQTFICFQANSSSSLNIYMVSSKLTLELKLFLCFRASSSSSSKLFFGARNPLVEQHKMLGQIVRSDLRTISNTEYICRKAFKRMWIIRRLKAMDCPERELLEVLQQQIVSVCEVGVAW